MEHKFILIVIIVLLSTGCTSNVPSISGIDMERWRADARGCGGVRSLSSDTLTLQKDKLLALSESGVVEVLGAPDLRELSRRNQKFYYYYLEPDSTCGKATGSSRPSRLAVRFNAVGLAKEVRVETNY